MKKIIFVLLIFIGCKKNKEMLPIIDSKYTFPQPVQLGSFVNNDWNSSSWTYSGTGLATFNTNDITMNGGTGSSASILRYSALPLAFKNLTATVRVQVSDITAGDGVVGFGFLSRRDANLKRYVLINCSTGADQGNMLRLGMPDTFEAETNPTLISFANGETIEIVMELGQVAMNFKVRNYTQGGAFISLNKTMSLTFGSGDQNIADVYDIMLINRSGTNKITYFDLSTTENKYADVFVGTSKVHGYYAVTEAQTAAKVYGTAKSRQTVNLGAQSCALEHFVLLNPLINILKPRRVIFADPFRNNISASTFDATAKANFQLMVSNANSLRSDIWYQYALPEAVLDQSAGDTYLNSVAPLNKIVPVPSGWAHGTHTSDGTHPNVAGNLLWGTTIANTILR